MDVTGFYGSGVRHAWIRSAADEVADLDAVVTVGADTDVESTDIPGDDAIKASLKSNAKSSLTIEFNSLSLEASAIMSGNPVVQTAYVDDTPGPEVQQSAEIAGGTDAELNAPYVEIGAVTVGKAADGRNAYLVRTFHKVQCGPITTEQSNGDETTWSCDADAFPTALDVAGEALASKRIDTRKIVIGEFVDTGGAY